MKFETWLKLQKKRDDRIGDLAKDFIDSLRYEVRLPFKRQINHVDNYDILSSMSRWDACYAAYDSLAEAWEEFSSSYQEDSNYNKKMLEFMKERYSSDEEEAHEAGAKVMAKYGKALDNLAKR